MVSAISGELTDTQNMDQPEEMPVKNLPTKMSAKNGNWDEVKIEREMRSHPIRAGMLPIMSAA